MARQTLTKLTALGAFNAYAANAADLTMTAADVANKEQFACSGKDLIFVHNTDAGVQTVTITSVDDAYGRAENITTYSMAAGEYAVFGPFVKHGWMQADGNIYLEASAATVKIGVVAVP